MSSYPDGVTEETKISLTIPTSEDFANESSLRLKIVHERSNENKESGGNKSSSNQKTTDQKRAFIVGASGHIGSLLAELLLSKGYAVHGLLRTSSTNGRCPYDQVSDG